jgi:hypothetical protein
MAVETKEHAQVREDERQAQVRENERLAKIGGKTDTKAEKALSPEEKADKELQEKNKKRNEDREKLIVDTIKNLTDAAEKLEDPRGVQILVSEIAERLRKTQTIAVGAEYGPTAKQIEELHAQKFPLTAPPLADGTPIANIAQVEKKEDDKTVKPSHAVAGK